MVVCALLKFRVSFLRFPVSCRIHLQSAAMKNLVPDRWTEYAPVGKRIPGTRFIAFKVPLKSLYDHKLAPGQRFSPSDLIMEIEKQNEELGLIVDLTCTNRYYSHQELPETVMYCKIFTVGQQVPSNEVVTQFKYVIKQYLNQNSKNDKLVGVHCTHGLNRTGYLVCRYLIDMLSMEPSEAIEKFNNSRGHSIERSNYLDDLLRRKSKSSAELDKPEANDTQHFSRKNVNSHPGPVKQPRNHGAGLHKPEARHQQHFSRKHANSQPSPGPAGQPRSYGHTPDIWRRGPSFYEMPGQVRGPQNDFSHSGWKYPSHGSWTPPSGFPHMAGPRYSLPQMEGHLPHHFRGPSRHHAKRAYPQHRDHDAVNGASPQDCRPHFPQQTDDNPGNYFSAQPSHSQEYGNDYTYQRYPRHGRKKNRNKQCQ